MRQGALDFFNMLWVARINEQMQVYRINSWQFWRRSEFDIRKQHLELGEFSLLSIFQYLLVSLNCAVVRYADDGDSTL